MYISKCVTCYNLQVSCYDFDEGDEHDLIGQFETSVAQLGQGSVDQQVNETDWPISNPSPALRKNTGSGKWTSLLHIKLIQIFTNLSILKLKSLHVYQGCKLHVLFKKSTFPQDY
jgi:hypothetical protein